MHTITITYTHSAPDGVQRTYSETYDREGDEGPEARYRQRIDRVTGNFAYFGYADDEAFRAHVIKQMHERGEGAYRTREGERERAELEQKFETLQAPFIGDVLQGLQERDDILAALRQAVVWHGAYVTLETLVVSESAKMLRATLRNAYKAARANVREEYPEEYREADPKDDFYEDHADDIAEALAGEI